MRRETDVRVMRNAKLNVGSMTGKRRALTDTMQRENVDGWTNGMGVLVVDISCAITV